MIRSELIKELKRDEGRVPHVYSDSEGWLTIGDGILVDKRRGGGLRPEEMDFILDNRLKLLEADYDRLLPVWRTFTELQQRALMNMGHQMGVSGVLKFKNMIEALKRGDGKSAESHALDSKWAKQTPERAARVAAMMKG